MRKDSLYFKKNHMRDTKMVKNVLPTDVLIKFCKYYNVSADYVLGLINEFRKLY